MCVWVGKEVGWGIGWGWGLAAPAHPSTMILWPRVTCFFACEHFLFIFFPIYSINFFLMDLRNEKTKKIERNKWRRVTISLRTGGQGQPTPIHTQGPFQLVATQTNTRKASKTLVFPLFDLCSRTNGPTDRWTDGRTDKATYRVACPQLKNAVKAQKQHLWLGQT